MRTSENSDKVLKAFAKFQTEVENPTKNKTAHVKTTKGKNYQYSYSSLDSILDDIKPLANKHGLSFSQEITTEDNQIGVTTYLLHESGQWLQFGPLHLDIERDGRMNANQAAGSTITYARRYAIESVAGIASQEDTDTQEINVKDDKNWGHNVRRHSDGLSDEKGSITKKQEKAIFAIASDSYNLSSTELKDWVDFEKGISVSDLSMQEASNLIDLFKNNEEKADKLITDWQGVVEREEKGLEEAVE